MRQTIILFVLLLFLLCALPLAAQSKADSVAINKKYDAKQQVLKQRYDERVEVVIANDPQLNQLRGASQQVEVARKEALDELSQKSEEKK